MFSSQNIANGRNRRLIKVYAASVTSCWPIAVKLDVVDGEASLKVLGDRGKTRPCGRFRNNLRGSDEDILLVIGASRGGAGAYELVNWADDISGACLTSLDLFALLMLRIIPDNL